MTEKYVVTTNETGYTVKRNDGASTNEFGPYIYNVSGDKASMWFSSKDGVITCLRRNTKGGVKEYSGVRMANSKATKDGDVMRVAIGGVQTLTLSEVEIAKFESDLVRYKDDPFNCEPKEPTGGDETNSQ